MQSTPLRRTANLAGGRGRRSKAGWNAPCVGIWRIETGGSRSAKAFMPASCWHWRRRQSKTMRTGRPILVIGRAGQLARCLVDEARAGDRVVARGRPEFDLEDADAAERILAEIEPQVVVNAAAYTAVDKPETAGAKAV